MNTIKKTLALILSILIMVLFCSPGFCRTGVKSKPHKAKKIVAVKHAKKHISHKKKSAVKHAKKPISRKKEPAVKSPKKQISLKNTAPSQIYVLSSSKEAEIYIDEDAFGKAPVNIKNAKPGRYLVEAYVGKELLFRQYVSVEPGIPSVVEIHGNKQVADEEKDHIIL